MRRGHIIRCHGTKRRMEASRDRRPELREERSLTDPKLEQLTFRSANIAAHRKRTEYKANRGFAGLSVRQ